MEGCACGGQRSAARFGPSIVTSCSACHRLGIEPMVDPRVPSREEHVRCLLEEIRLEEEGGPQRVLHGRVETASASSGGAEVRLHIERGQPKGVGPGSRLEGFLDEGRPPKPEESVNVEVVRGHSALMDIVVDSKAWADLRRGTVVVLRPANNATLYRNLLKAFLLVRKLDPDHGDLEDPAGLPRLVKRPIAERPGLTPAQAEATQRALDLPERGVLLVHGPPGTGKTTVIAAFLREAARRKQTVLVTSHTHVAIDNALRKAMRADPALAQVTVRLGEPGKVALDMADFNRRVSQYRDDPEKAKEEGRDALPLYKALQQRHRIVGMTLDALACSLMVCEANGEPIDRFDYAVVDEAGMNAYPKLAVAHAVAKRLVLVGDPLQLPPIVRAWSFRNDETYKRSHFETLQMMRPDLSVLLDRQHRSHPTLYEWPRDAVYAGKVSSGTKPTPPPVKLLAGQAVTSPVVWIDTARLAGNRAEPSGTSRVNPTHAAFAVELFKDLVKQGMRPDELGYISPFRAQAQLVADTIAADRRLVGLARMTVSTVDAFQGNERRLIVYDLTTMQPAKPHEDHRRLNVSLTRAQEGLVILGPRPFVRTAKENPFYWSLQRWEAVQVLQPQ